MIKIELANFKDENTLYKFSPDGLSLVYDMGFIRAFIVVSFLASSSIAHPSLKTLVDDCKFLLQRISQAEVKHVFREANKCEDGLANLGRIQEDDFVLFDSPPNLIYNAFSFDMSENFSLRFVSCNSS